MRKILLGATVIGGLAAASLAPAWAGQDVCENARSAGLQAVHAQFDSAISTNNEAIQGMRARGQNPDDIGIKVNGAFVPFSQYSATLEQNRTTLIAAANEQANGCNSGYIPYQQAAELLVASVTGGAEHLLPGKMGHIDVSEIMSGYPLGGPNAMIPQVRTQVFNALGMGPTNDLRKIIENPLGGPNSFFHKPFG